MKILKLFVALLALNIKCAQASPEEVVIADYTDWTRASAYFVKAPNSIKSKMSVHIKKYCSTNALPNENNQIAWLCSNKPLLFFSGITTKGKNSVSGFVCEKEFWFSSLRFFPEKMLNNVGCVELFWNSEEGDYEFIFKHT